MKILKNNNQVSKTLNKLLFGFLIVVSGASVGYFLAVVFSKSGESLAEVTKVNSKSDKRPEQSFSRGPSGSFSATDGFGYSPSRLALAAQLSWLSPDTLNEVVERWQVLLDGLDDDNVGEYCHHSLALLVLEEIARSNPEEILDQLIDAGNLHLRFGQLEVVASVWVKMYPQDFGRKVAELPDGTLKLTLDRALTRALVGLNPPLAFERLESAKVVRPGDFYQLFSAWAVSDREAALGVISKITDSGHQQEALGGIAKKFGEEDLQLAWEWVSDLTVAGREGLLRTLVTTASDEHETFLFDAVTELDDPALKSRVLLGNVSELSHLNLEKTYELVMSEFEGEKLYVAIANMIPQSVQENPQLALDAVEQMPQGDLRDRLVVKLSRAWSAVDSQAAFEWSREMGLAEAIDFKEIAKDQQPIVWGF